MLEKHESIPLIDKPEEKKAEENGGEELVEKSSVEKSSVKECVTDLDALVEKWIDFMYETTNVPEKAKCFSSFFSGSRSKREPELKDYDVEIDWTNVNFEQEETLFDSDKVIIGNNTSQTLLQTSFVNRTSQDQESSFKMERTTTQVCEFSFDKGFKSTQKPGFTLLIPQDIVQVDASIKRERSLVAGQNVVAKEEVTWKCDSVIKVKPNSTTFGSLVITEMKMDKTFKGVVWIEGRLFCKLKKKKQAIEQVFSADMFQIIDLAYKSSWLPANGKNFETFDNKVKANFAGQCKFRLGYNQRVELREEDLKPESG